MENNQTLYGLNYQIEQLQRQKETLKKELAKSKLGEVAEFIYTESAKDPLSKREIENILYTLYLDLKNIIED